MITPSARWRFVEEIDDKGYFEDELVQHHLVEFRALRRSFSDKFCADKIAVEEVCEQMKLAARCNSTLLPIVFAIEEVEGRLTVIMELIKGQGIKHLVTRGELSKARPFSEFAHRFVRNLLDARQVGARFDRLDVNQIVIVPSGDICVTQRFPIGRIPPERLEKSPYLRRLNAQIAGGVYTANEPPDERAELHVLREMLTKAAAGSTKISFDELRAEAAQNPRMYHSPLARVDKEIAQILIRLSSDPGADGQIISMEGLEDALSSLKRASQAKKEQPGLEKPLEYATYDNLPPSVAPPSPGSSPVTPLPSPRISQSLYKMPDESALPEKSGETSGIKAGPAPLPDPISGGMKSPAPKKTKVKKAAAGLDMPEDLNPYASDEEKAAARVKEQSSGSVLSPVARRKTDKGPIIKMASIGFLAIILIAAGIVFVPPLLSSPEPNEPPVARVMPLGSAFAVNEEVHLDASGSSDPEGQDLIFFWQTESPDTVVIYTDPETGRVSSKANFVVRSPKIIAQFQGAGEHVLELKVKDQAQFSEPVRVSVTVK